MRSGSFNIVHLAIALFVSVVVVALVLPLLSSTSDRGPSHNSTQLRGIHQALVTYANSNKNWYPGLDSQGEYARDEPGHRDLLLVPDDPAPQIGIHVEDRYAILLDGEFIMPGYIVSPSETDRSIEQWPESGRVTSKHYSFALLQVPQKGARREEWKQTLNAQAILLSDRNTGTENRTSSIYDNGDGGPWRGRVLWNDNHVSFESEPIFETHYGETAIADDNLFSSTGDDDAYLIHSGN